MKKIFASLIIVLSIINLIYSQDWHNDKDNYIVYVEGQNKFKTNEIEIVLCGDKGVFVDEFAYVNVHYFKDGEVDKVHGLGLEVSADGSEGIVRDMNMCGRVREWLNVEGQTIEFSNENFSIRLRGKMPFIGEKK